MGIRSTVFSGPTNLMAMGHPFIAPGSPDTPGVPFAIDVRTRELIVFDPWLLKNSAIINTAFGIVLGPKGFGKSASLKILAVRLMMVAAGYEMMRVSINDHKPEGKASEYAPLGRVSQSKVFHIGKMNVNLFEPRLFKSHADDVYELGLLGIAEMLCEFVNEGKLIGHQGTALRVTMHKMLKLDESLWSPHVLFKLLRSIFDQDIKDYYRELDTKLKTQLEKRMLLVGRHAGHTEDTFSQIRDLTSRDDNVDLEDVRRAGDYVATLFDSVLNGSYGHMFGTEHSLYDMYTQRAVVKDWRDVQPEPETLMRAIETRIKSSAIENNRMDLLPHIELDDEKHKSMDNLVYARSHSYFSEIARGTHVCNLSATHRLGSIRKGAAGSELDRLGGTIINNLGFALIGNQPDEPAVLNELQSRYNLSNADTRELTKLPPYVFGIKLGEQSKIRFGRVFATPLEIADILPTDGATDRMVDRPQMFNPAQLERYAMENGVSYLGINDVA